MALPVLPVAPKTAICVDLVELMIDDENLKKMNLAACSSISFVHGKNTVWSKHETKASYIGH